MHVRRTLNERRGGLGRPVSPGIITDTALTPPAGPEHSDATVGIELLLHDPAGPGEPVGFATGWEVLADSAYGTGEALAALQQAGHTPIIKPWPLRPAVEGGFTLDQFHVIDPPPTGRARSPARTASPARSFLPAT